MYDRGRELITPSISTTYCGEQFIEGEVCSFHHLTQAALGWFDHSFENTIPAECTFNIENPWLARYSWTVSSLKTALRNFTAALNIFPLSDRNLRDRPCLAANHFRHCMNVMVDRLDMMSKWMAQVNKQIHALLLSLDDPFRTGDLRNPCPYRWKLWFPSSWILAEVVIVDQSNGAPSCFLQVVHLCIIAQIRPQPLMTQYLRWTSVRVSFTPLWLTHWWASRTTRPVKGCFLQFHEGSMWLEDCVRLPFGLDIVHCS